MRGLSAFCETVNEKTMTEEIKKISILCVQMNGESRDVMKQVWEDLEIADKTFYDNIGDIQPNEIFVQWDGRANKARVYLAAMHQQFPKVPTFLLMGRDLIAEERELTKKVKVHDIFNIPFDAIKIRTYFFNKYGNHEEEEEGETGESASAEASSSAETDAAGAQPAGPGRTPQEAKAASGASPAPVRSPAKPKKIKTAEMITAPMGLSDITVIDKVKEAFHRAAQPPEGGGIKDGIEYISNQEVLFFDTDVAAIPGFEKQIQTFGFSNVRGFIDPQAILTKLRQGRGQAIFLWYTGQFRAPGELLQEIVEMRDLHRMYLILFIPGEEAVRKFVANFPHLPVDGLILRGHKKGIIVEKLNELWDEKSATQKFIQTLHGLRENWRNNRYNIPRKGISEKMLTEAKALIESNPHKAYLIHAELMSQEILKGNKEGIKSYFELFKPFMGKSYDAVIQYAIAKASTENTENATTWLMH